MSDAQKPLIIKDFQKGTADSPHLGHALMQNIDIEMYPGAMKPQKTNYPLINTIVQDTFTADAGTDRCTADNGIRTASEIAFNLNYDGAAVYFTTTGTLPAGLSTGTPYFLYFISNYVFQVATSFANLQNGVYVDITNTGSGVHTVKPITIGSIKHIKRDNRGGNYFAIDSRGRVWFTYGGQNFYLLLNSAIENVTGSLTNASGNGLEIFSTSDNNHTYLFAFRNVYIDVIDVYGNTQILADSWTNAWQTMNTGAGSSNRHFSLLGQDNIIYFTDDRYVGSIMEKVGQVFDPSSAATYTFNNQALTMPQQEITWCLEELGINLLVGGKTFNKIYPWDRSSNSFTLPLIVPEYSVYEMRNLGNVIYVFAGSKGNIYVTQGTYVKHFKALSPYVINQTGATDVAPMTWGGSAVRSGAILFGMSTQTTANNGTYILYPDGRWLMDSTPYPGGLIVTAIYAKNDYYLAGYSANLDTPYQTRVTNFAAIYHSPLYRVADKTHKAAYTQLEVQIARPSSGGEIRVSWRADETSSWTVIATFTGDSTTTSFQQDAGLTDIENIQIMVEFDYTVEIMEVRLFP